MTSPSSTLSIGVPALAALLATSALSSAGAVWLFRPAAAPVPNTPECICKCEAAPIANRPPPPPPPVHAPSPSPVIAGRACKGMTWSLLKQEKNVVRVGSDPAHTNAYAGDTSCETELSVLCINPKNLPKPEGVASDFYSGWSGAEVAATKPVAGSVLTSREAADALCSKMLGTGWRMAEHHDGKGGWGLAGFGEVSRDARFWVAINDQPANPWNSAPQ